MAGITINQGKFSAQKNKLRKTLEAKILATRDQLETAMKPIVAKAAEELGERTFPGPNAIGLAVGAMRYDITRVYITAGAAYEIIEKSAGPRRAGAFYSAMKNGNFAAARGILRSAGTPIASIRLGEPLDPQLHKRSRNASGRVKLSQPLQICEREEIQAYIKQAISEIGKTSAGWYAAAAALGGDGNAIPWKGIARHGSQGGSASIQRTNSAITITIRNHSSLARKHLSAGQVAPICERAKQKIREAMLSAFRSA